MWRFKHWFFWVAVVVTLTDEFTPFIPFIGIVAMIGLFKVGILRHFARILNQYCDSAERRREE